VVFRTNQAYLSIVGIVGMKDAAWSDHQPTTAVSMGRGFELSGGHHPAACGLQDLQAVSASLRLVASDMRAKSAAGVV